MLGLGADRRSQLEEAQTRRTWCLPLVEQNYFRKIVPSYFFPRIIQVYPPSIPSLSPRVTNLPTWLLFLNMLIFPPRSYSQLSLHRAFSSALLGKFKRIDFQPILSYLCSMTIRSRFCSCWGPKLRANLRAKSLISMKAGSSFRSWGPCSCSSSVYNCVQETWCIWEREEQGGNKER